MKLASFCAIAALALLGACASSAPQPPSNTAFDPAACVERRFAVYFEENAELTAEAREAISAVERSLNGCRIERVRIVGFDEVQSAEQEAMEVSQARADAVAAYLESTTSWPRSVYEVAARGDARATNAEGEERPMRRRARVVVTAAPPTP